ncbi:MAG: hypothetical protein A3A44_00670 [Candidatus Sungbacteria bacterium RIFCSPLOWO2_01_FULL_60_25]|uniref:Glycosyltransferase RgtA/B/C/D-like domain-containing protein n=1 Tax=Candidatus Sungbacteria bacterium RIFCSPLOWO2_01_FULL_60_25 TaxID=1802281 RepID=A0A1G2LBP1_9BACT|nr:MAG: hypothetical protein A3A44_00670 [Candidatus Sungbacteria bacterium RIFCSPLOWO2_01_FULL_60_25]
MIKTQNTKNVWSFRILDLFGIWNLFFGIFRKPIVWVLLGAFVLRLFGIPYGFPLFLVNDEPAFVLGALKMMELKTLVPAWHSAEFQKVLYYPPFLAYFYLIALAPVLAVHYLASGLPSLAAYQDAFTMNPSFLWIAARVLNALMGVLLIYVVYRLAQKVTSSERASLLAALFLAVSFYEIQLSQVVRHWMPASLLVYLAWLASERIRSSGSWRAYVGTGIFAGIGMGVNTSAIIALLPAALGHFGRDISWMGKMFSLRFWSLVIVSLVIVAISVALYPYGFTRGEGAASPGGDILMRLGFLADKSFGAWLAFLGDYAKLLIWYEPLLLLGAAFGFVFMLRHNRPFTVHCSLFTVSYISLLYLFFNEIPRALIMIIPAFAVLAGFGVDRIMLWLQSRMSAVAARGVGIPLLLGVFFFAYAAVTDMRYSILLFRKETRLVAREWIRENIPGGTKIVADLPYLRLTNTKEGIRELASYDSSGLRSQDRVLLRTANRAYPQPAFHVLNLHYVSPGASGGLPQTADDFRRQGYRYVVVEYGHADKADLDSRTRGLIEGLPLVERFAPFTGEKFDRALSLSGEIASVPPWALFSFDRFGAFVDVYAL